MPKSKTKPNTLLFKLPVKLPGTNKTVYVEEEEGNLRVGTRGDSLEPGILFGCMTKSDARRVRKALHAEGFHEQAAAKRLSI